MQLQNVQGEFAQAITEDSGMQGVYPWENVCIYQNNIFSSLLHALQETYPMVLKLIGAPFFRRTAREYIERYPSRSPNLHDYGEYFSSFIAEQPSLKNLIYLAEVAQFEWYCHMLAVAPEHEGLDVAVIEKLTPDQYEHIQFILHPASKLMKCHFPMLRIIDLCQQQIEGTLNLDEGGVNLLIIRRNFEIRVMPLNAAEFTFLSALDNNCSLAQALNAALNTGVPFQLEVTLPAMIKSRTIVDCFLQK